MQGLTGRVQAAATGGAALNAEEWQAVLAGLQAAEAAGMAATRLRGALDDAGVHLPDASLAELSVHAARQIRRAAKQECTRAERAATRALPSSATGDPWRVGAFLVGYRGGVRGRATRIETREAQEGGDVLTVRGSRAQLRRRPGAQVAQQGPNWDATYYVSDQIPHEEALTLLPTRRHTGEARTWGVPGVQGVKHNASPSAVIVARSRAEVIELCRAQGHSLSMSFLSGYGLLEPGGVIAQAALERPGVLMVADEELTGTPGTATPHAEWAAQVAARREALLRAHTDRRPVE